MLFRKRATQREHFDDPARTQEEIRDGYAQLARVNRLFHLADPYTRLLSRWLGAAHCERLSILDVGAGSGEVACAEAMPGRSVMAAAAMAPRAKGAAQRLTRRRSVLRTRAAEQTRARRAAAGA